MPVAEQLHKHSLFPRKEKTCPEGARVPISTHPGSRKPSGRKGTGGGARSALGGRVGGHGYFGRCQFVRVHRFAAHLMRPNKQNLFQPRVQSRRPWRTHQGDETQRRGFQIFDPLLGACGNDDRVSGAHVVSVDEKTGIQALERRHATKPVRPGLLERLEFEYRRHGTFQCQRSLPGLPLRAASRPLDAWPSRRRSDAVSADSR